jgi:hypothetical protein
MLKRVALVLVLLVAGAGLALGMYVRATVKSVPRLFKRNAELKAQGYYMAQFEFKMVSVQYYLNEGQYAKAWCTLSRVKHEMETGEGLVKMPEGASPEEQMAFLLEQQDPRTGAFMDPDYPLFSYISPTLNTVLALDDLARRTGKPLQLKYPLRFLDQIKTPDELRAFLNSLLYLKKPWDRLPGPGPYVVLSELAYFDVLERAGVYQFSDEWEDALRKFYSETQDPESGYWGARVGGPGKWRQRRDVNSTYHVLALVVDEHGQDRSAKYPLGFADLLARNILASANEPLPDDAAQQHGWCLTQSQGAGIVTRLLWLHLSAAEQAEARADMPIWLTQRYRLLRPADGGFALYSSAPSSDVDGTSSALKLIRYTGCLPGTWERERLWGTVLPLPAPVRQEVRAWEDAKLPAISGVNSIRIYQDAPPAGDGYDDANLVRIIYATDSPVLDVMDLRQHLAAFLAAGGQMFGNWQTKESLRDQPLDLAREIKSVPVTRGAPDLPRIAGDRPDAARLYAVGYDLFNVPLYVMECVKTGEP